MKIIGWLPEMDIQLQYGAGSDLNPRVLRLQLQLSRNKLSLKASTPALKKFEAKSRTSSFDKKN